MSKDRAASDSRARNPVEPFLRWAGGKRSLIKHFRKFFPPDIHQRPYIEPFLGAGSVFFELQPDIAVLADSNKHLIECYEFVQDCPELVADYLRDHRKKNCEDYYYHIRDVYNRSKPSAAQAARFIYLNKACFNGIFRVNLKGEFNVPYGRKEPPYLPDRDWLRQVGAVLENAILSPASFEETLESVTGDDFIYLDPPYPPLNNTSNFTRYTKDQFSIDDQKRLAEIVYELDARGCLVMMSNADVPLINELYEKFDRFSLPVTRWITCKSIKHQVNELIITNYEVE